jgi:hypothetical protein
MADGTVVLKQSLTGYGLFIVLEFCENPGVFAPRLEEPEISLQLNPQL